MLCQNNSHVVSIMQQVVVNGGEGMILRKCGSLYHPGRSPNLVKLKVIIFLFTLLFYFMLFCFTYFIYFTYFNYFTYFTLLIFFTYLIFIVL